MSGLEDRVGVPDCPVCGASNEFYLSGGMWLFPEKSREKRCLRFSALFDKASVLNVNKSLAMNNNITCLSCGHDFPYKDPFFKELMMIARHLYKTGEYYGERKSFDKDDKHNPFF